MGKVDVWQDSDSLGYAMPTLRIFMLDIYYFSVPYKIFCARLSITGLLRSENDIFFNFLSFGEGKDGKLFSKGNYFFPNERKYFPIDKQNKLISSIYFPNHVVWLVEIRSKIQLQRFGLKCDYPIQKSKISSNRNSELNTLSFGQHFHT